MNEKHIINDVFESYNYMIKAYQDLILNSENTELRKQLQEIRNSSEVFQYELFRIAKLKNYYVSPPIVPSSEISDIKKSTEN